MSITVEGPDGAIHEFPEGTSRDVIKRVLDRRYGRGPETQAGRTSAVAWAMDRTGVGTPKRSLFERFADNVANTVNTAPALEFARSRFVNPLAGLRGVMAPLERAAEQADRVEQLFDAFTGKPVKPLPGQPGDLKGVVGKTVRDAVDAVPALQAGGAGFSLAGEFADRVTPGTRDRIAGQERQRRADFAAKSKADPFHKADGGVAGKTAHGAAALLGVLSGTALDPTSYLTAGEGALARVLVQGGLAGGADLFAQVSAQDAGLQKEIDPAQSVMSAAAGLTFAGLAEGGTAAGKALREAKVAKASESPSLDGHFKAELDAADLLAKPALTTRDLPDLRAANDNPAPRPYEPANDHAGQRQGASAGADGQAGTGDTWDRVDWGAGGSEQRRAAAAAHLETLRRTMKPEHAQAFGQWVARGAPRLLGASAHARVNPDWVDWDKLSSNPDEFLSLEAALQAFFKDTFEQAGTKAQGWDVTRSAAKLFGAKLSDIAVAHGQIVGAQGEAGIAAKLVALQSVADAHADNLAQHIAAMRLRVDQGDVNAADVAKLAAGVQEATLMDAMTAGSSSEVGRALNVLKLARERRRATNDLASAFDFLREATGQGGDIDPSKLRDVLDRMGDGFRKRGAAGLKDEIRKFREVGFWDYSGYLITGGLLSAPKSFLRNVMGSGLFVPLNIVERYVAAGIGAARTGLGRGGPERVTFREANAYAAAVRSSFVDAMRAAVSAFKSGGGVDTSSVLPSDRTGFVPFKMDADRWRRWRANPLANVGDMLGWGVFSATRTLGFRPTIAMDEFTKVLGRQMQLSALAVREAHYRAAREADPAVASTVYAETLEAIRQEPTAEAVKLAREFFEDTMQDAEGVYMGGTRAEDMARILASVDARRLAEDHAQDLAFQRIGPKAKKIDEALRVIPALKYFYAPFFRTPVALLKAGLVDRTPLTVLANHKALTSAAAAMDQAMDRGGAEADIAWAKLTVGMGVMALAFSLWENGQLVGGRGDRRNAERMDGVRPYSLKIGDAWVEFSPLSPLAEPFGLVADLADILADKQPDQDQGEAMVGAILSAISNSILNKTMLQGLHQLNGLLFGDVPGASAEVRADAAGDSLAQTLMSAVPLSSLLRSTAQEIDPVRRDAHGLLDRLQAMTPGLSERLPAARDVFGRPLVRAEGERGAFQALNVSERSEDPLELELSRLGRAADLSLAKPSRRFNGERLEPEEYAHLLEVQGQLWRHPRTGMNMEKAVRDLIQTDEYQGYGDDHRAFLVHQVVSKYRKLANRALKDPDSEFYWRETARRTASAAIRKEVSRKGLSRQRAVRRAENLGMTRVDAVAEIEQLRQALDLED
ncbi:hypothetical protein CA606_09195 [Caulobacter vibrioides]|uniref:Uncharacterized protein n=1 Tax=Caulobacter vibrioides TaxID=155892 RepID=A0A290MVW7_CAUVI|nr:hypothetical protein [Caulobacter vibrioides]ATC32509.1 hypothetical protein CA606_09195 [Caulobacter vibrioides]